MDRLETLDWVSWASIHRTGRQARGDRRPHPGDGCRRDGPHRRRPDRDHGPAGERHRHEGPCRGGEDRRRVRTPRRDRDGRAATSTTYMDPIASRAKTTITLVTVLAILVLLYFVLLHLILFRAGRRLGHERQRTDERIQVCRIPLIRSPDPHGCPGRRAGTRGSDRRSARSGRSGTAAQAPVAALAPSPAPAPVAAPGPARASAPIRLRPPRRLRQSPTTTPPSPWRHPTRPDPDRQPVAPRRHERPSAVNARRAFQRFSGPNSLIIELPSEPAATARSNRRIERWACTGRREPGVQPVPAGS